MLQRFFLRYSREEHWVKPNPPTLPRYEPQGPGISFVLVLLPLDQLSILVGGVLLFLASIWGVSILQVQLTTCPYLTKLVARAIEP